MPWKIPSPWLSMTALDFITQQTSVEKIITLNTNFERTGLPFCFKKKTKNKKKHARIFIHYLWSTTIFEIQVMFITRFTFMKIETPLFVLLLFDGINCSRSCLISRRDTSCCSYLSPFMTLFLTLTRRFFSLSQLFRPSAQRTLQTKNNYSTMTFGTIVWVYDINVTLTILFSGQNMYKYTKSRHYASNNIVQPQVSVFIKKYHNLIGKQIVWWEAFSKTSFCTTHGIVCSIQYPVCYCFSSYNHNTFQIFRIMKHHRETKMKWHQTALNNIGSVWALSVLQNKIYSAIPFLYF